MERGTITGLALRRMFRGAVAAALPVRRAVEPSPVAATALRAGGFQRAHLPHLDVPVLERSGTPYTTPPDQTIHRKPALTCWTSAPRGCAGSATARTLARDGQLGVSVES
jgi:hypothetical protein